MGRMRFRKLRVAFSVTCGIACVLLIVLWGRSQWWNERVVWSDAGLRMESKRGILKIEAGTQERSYYSKSLVTDLSVRNQWQLLRYGAMFPHWILVLILGGLAASPFASRPTSRFSLRALLIVTSVIALGLGTIVFVARK